jgi:hypothetical protein
MECKYNKDIIYYKWIVINKKTQIEYLKRKELHINFHYVLYLEL